MRFRRPIRRPRLMRHLLRNELPNEEQFDLSRAHHLMEIGEYQQAGAVFWRLTEYSENRKFLGRAPFLYIQAGRAFTRLGSDKLADEGIIRGFVILAGQKRWHALKQISDQVLRELNLSNQTGIARSVESWLQENTPEIIPAIPNQTHPPLPPKCPYCGATATPAGVEWLDDNTAACNYCGSVITK